jgi:phenylacetic acid degradation operon negative regulatory protein
MLDRVNAAVATAPVPAHSNGTMRSQDLTITILGSHMRRAGGRVWSGGMVKLIGEFGFSTEAVRAALSRLVTRGMLERHRDGRMINYALTPRAQELLAEGDRRIFSFGRRAPGADAWTLLWHTIPEDRRVERSRLASRLRFLGFGSLQDATWIAASDREEEVRALVDTLAVGDYVSIFLARMARGSEQAILSSGAWDLGALGPRYDEFLAAFSPLTKATARRALSDREAFVTRTRLMHSFRGFSLVDPELPDSIAPLLDRRAEAIKTFDAVYEGLAGAADRHFEEIAVPAERG